MKNVDANGALIEVGEHVVVIRGAIHVVVTGIKETNGEILFIVSWGGIATIPVFPEEIRKLEPEELI